MKKLNTHGIAEIKSQFEEITGRRALDVSDIVDHIEYKAECGDSAEYEIGGHHTLSKRPEIIHVSAIGWTHESR